MMDALYKCTIPTAVDVIDSIQVAEKSQHEQRLTTWVHRYIRSCSQSDLCFFLRFITGSKSFIPKTVIKLEYANQPPDHLRPNSKTCFKILTLPRQYSSFTQLRENFSLHMGNTDNWYLHDAKP